MLPADLVAALAPGTVITGKYRVERLLGKGGMGVVVAARHLGLNQNVAIKVLLPTAERNDEATTRFLREGRAAAQLQSPYVTKVHDIGELASGEPYLVMELLRGRDLRAHLAEVKKVPLAQATEWILEAANALAEAHKLNIVHRDIKPANLFVAETTAGQQIKVLDFGISKQLDSAEGDLTSTAMTVGTPRYMSPEQMRSSKFASARGDIWSLGIVLYELTTGRTPFQGDTITAMCLDVVERPHTPPSQLTPDLPREFDDFMDRCLAKKPEQRFQSMEEFAAGLRTVCPESPRISRLFDTPQDSSSSQPAIAVSAQTPAPEPATIVLKGASPPQVESMDAGETPAPEVLPQSETMQSWNTTAWSRPARKAQRIRLFAIAGIAAALLGVLIIALMWRRGPQLPAAAGSAAPSVPPPVEPSAAAVKGPDIVPSDTSPPSPTTETTTASATSAPTHAPPRKVTPTAPPSPTPAVNCNPPYTIDEKGHKHAKPQCL